MCISWAAPRGFCSPPVCKSLFSLRCSSPSGCGTATPPEYWCMGGLPRWEWDSEASCAGKKGSSEFPSLFSAVASVKGHVFGPSSLRLHIGGGEASGFPTRLTLVQVPLDSAIGAEHPAPRQAHLREPRRHLQLSLSCFHRATSREMSSWGLQGVSWSPRSEQADE